MADEEEKDNKKTDKSNEQATEKSSNLKLIIMIAGGGLLVLVVVFVLLFTGDEENITEQLAKKNKSFESKLSFYVPLPEETLVAFYDKHGGVHHLNLKIVLLVRDKDASERIKKNVALLASGYVTDIENFKYKKLKTLKGKRLLRRVLLKRTRRIFPGAGPMVEEVLFNKFLMD